MSDSAKVQDIKMKSHQADDISPGENYIQPKLTIGAINDSYEKEANTVADKIMRMPEQNFLQRKCAHCEEEEKKQVQRKPVSPNISTRIQAKGETGNPFSSSLGDKINSSKGGGNSMDGHTQSFMQSRFSNDFSNVKIHTGGEAVQMNQELNAKAFTVGNDIYFNEGQYQPSSENGKHLLAHELTHSIQQSNNATSTASGNGIVQRFASEEHQKMGDVATGKTSYNLGTAADKFELTHGDILALSGDVFMPDELFTLASTPGDKGKKKGTRDEILWALQDTRIWEMRAEKTGANPFAQQQDPRFQGSGPFAGFTFSEDVKAAVFEKYQKLGAANASHFVAPVGRKRGAPIPSAESTGSKYLQYHEGAIDSADTAGRAGTPVDMAMAYDAAAQHYLTDAFSAGHLRTPIASIREYWGNKYPLFWYNLRHKIALDTGIELAKGHTVITNNRAYSGILGAVEAMAPTLPAVTLGDLIGSIYHDVDNESGINIKGGGKIFGDKHLDASTEKLAVDAIKASNNDITKAFDHGKTTAMPVPKKDLFKEVRKAGGGSGTKYAAELMIPEPDPKEPAQNWKASDINKLWDQKFLGKTGDTVGDVISKRVQGGSIAIQLTALGDRFPVNQDVLFGQIQLHPRAAYLSGFVKKLQADPKAGVLDIINWVPHDMWTGDAEGDVIKDLKSKGDAGNKTENLGTMSHEQRVKFVKQFLSDGQPGWFRAGNPGAYDNLFILFENIDAKERKKVYKDIEGRSWNGAIKADDEFSFKIRVQDKGKDKDIMDKTRVDKFKKIMKGK